MSYPPNQQAQPRPNQNSGCLFASLGCGAGCMLYPILSSVLIIIVLILAFVFLGMPMPTVTKTSTGVVITNHTNKSISSMNVTLDTKDSLHPKQVYYFTANQLRVPPQNQSVTLPYSTFKAPSGHPLNVNRFHVTGFRIDYNNSWGGVSHFSGSL